MWKGWPLWKKCGLNSLPQGTVPCVNSFYTLSVDQNRHFWPLPSPPHLVHVVIEWPLMRICLMPIFPIPKICVLNRGTSLSLARPSRPEVVWLVFCGSLGRLRCLDFRRTRASKWIQSGLQISTNIRKLLLI